MKALKQQNFIQTAETDVVAEWLGEGRVRLAAKKPGRWNV
jgi:hypothetical protein